MSDVNSVVLVGRLTRDAELKYTQGGMAICRFSLAINRRRKNGEEWVEEANYFDIVLWGKAGETINQYLTKGKQVAIEGELRQNRWEQDGQARSKVEIFANNVQLLGGGAGERSSSGPRNYGQQASSSGDYEAETRSPSPRQKPADDFNDDIPF